MNEELDIKKRIRKANNTVQTLSHKELIEYIAHMEQGYDNLRSTIKTYDGIANNLCKKNENLKQQLKDKDEKISKVNDIIKLMQSNFIDNNACFIDYDDYLWNLKNILEILESE